VLSKGLEEQEELVLDFAIDFIQTVYLAKWKDSLSRR
jgi:hypothetical protein